MYRNVHNNIVTGSKNLATSPVLSNRRMNKLRYTHTVEYYISYQNNYSDMQQEMILQNVMLNLKSKDYV